MLLVGRNGISRRQIFWTRYWRWTRQESAVVTWPEYEEVLIKMGEYIVHVGGDPDGSITLALDNVRTAKASRLGEAGQR